ncbi:MAG: metal/formaldehyde-sensitive transcriptional repressor [Acidobacteria bacterium]|nr:metal/formaldehyde-sensitive transcriptional repressor [Acidobacteriota bacterium]MBV9147275.1 metal/formaldehyde-sensitive transcriptional repressor [Acidobacteriota bacterium]MBV9435399.1 metal/formaldehyde-sensitive transcriptional repressor [Acidobacteriota bacterium]
MSHTIRNKEKLLKRIRRIRGQVEAVERALEAGKDCSDVLHGISAARGALNGLMAEVFEDHIRHHLGTNGTRNRKDLEEVVEVMRSYMK